MSYDYKKKCTFVPMSSKGRVKYKKKAKTSIITNKSQILKEWRDSWFKGQYETDN